MLLTVLLAQERIWALGSLLIRSVDVRRKKTNLGDFCFLVLSFDACRTTAGAFLNCSLNGLSNKQIESRLTGKTLKRLWNQGCQSAIWKEARLPLLFIALEDERMILMLIAKMGTFKHLPSPKKPMGHLLRDAWTSKQWVARSLHTSAHLAILLVRPTGP